MSLRVMTLVFASDLPPIERLVALALADWAHDDGTHVYPSIKTMAKKVGLGTTATRQAVRRLERLGAIEVVDEGGGRSRPRTYRFSTAWMNATHRVGFTPPTEETIPTPEDEKPNASDMETQRLSDETQRLGVAEPLEPLVTTEPLGTVRVSPARDDLFEIFALAQTGRAYVPGMPLTDGERGKINKATAMARKVGYTAADLTEAIEGWGIAMPQGTGITALGLVNNATRCINAYRGASFTVHETDDRRRLIEAVAEGVESGQRMRAER